MSGWDYHRHTEECYSFDANGNMTQPCDLSDEPGIVLVAQLPVENLEELG